MRSENREGMRHEPLPPTTSVVSIPRQTVSFPSFTISLPITSYIDGQVQSLESLHIRLSSPPSLPSPWMIASTAPLTLCKLRVETSRPYIMATIKISRKPEWTLFVLDKLNSGKCSLLADLPSNLTSVAVVCRMLMLLNSANVCMGNPDGKFLEVLNHRFLTMHGSSKCLISRLVGILIIFW